MEGKDIHIVVTPSGHYALGEPQEDYEKTIKFEEEKLGSLTLRYSGSGIGLAKFVEILKALALVEKGAYLLAYIWLKDLMDEDLLQLIKGAWGDRVYNNLVVEILLGSFSEVILPVSEDPQEVLKKLIEEGGTYHTRVVGIVHRIGDLRDAEKNLILKEGDKVYVVWDQGNEHDENALAVYHGSGKKVGYIRRTIAKVLVGKVKEAGHLEGSISLIWDEKSYRPQVFINLRI